MRHFVFFFFLFVLFLPVFADAEEGAAPAQNSLPERIARPMIAIDPMTLKAEGVEIRLWGIKAAETNETPLELRALDLLDKLIAGQVVNCKIEGGNLSVMFGRCVAQGKEDLALALLNSGLAVRDRRQTYNTPFATAYGQAEEFARLNRRGVWSHVTGDDGAERKEEGGVPQWSLILSMFIIPVVGFSVIGFLLWISLQKMADAQRADVEEERKKEAMLETRERRVLLTTLQGEIFENKNKIEAFLVIYGDMLRGLQEKGAQPKYQQVGDIIQKHPSFSKTVFEANVGKMSLLGIKTAGQLSKLYAAFPKEQEYINLDPTVPIDSAVKLVEKILDDARALQPQVDMVLADLQAAAEEKA